MRTSTGIGSTYGPGQRTEEPLDERNTEFPMIPANLIGRRNRYTYNVSINNDFTMYFDGLVKYDLETGTSDRYGLVPVGSGPRRPSPPAEEQPARTTATSSASSTTPPSIAPNS